LPSYPSYPQYPAYPPPAPAGEAQPEPPPDEEGFEAPIEELIRDAAGDRPTLDEIPYENELLADDYLLPEEEPLPGDAGEVDLDKELAGLLPEDALAETEELETEEPEPEEPELQLGASAAASAESDIMLEVELEEPEAAEPDESEEPDTESEPEPEPADELESEPELEPKPESADELEPEPESEPETVSGLEPEPMLPEERIPEPAPVMPQGPETLPSPPPPDTEKEPDGEAGLLDYLATLTKSLPAKKQSEFEHSEARLKLEYLKSRLRGHPGLKRDVERSVPSVPSASSVALTPKRLTDTLTYIGAISGFHPDPGIGTALKSRVAAVLERIRQLKEGSL
jgi:hypothetical protein